MKIMDIVSAGGGTAFSFEVLPPLKGNGTDALFRTIERLKEFNPRYINITTHRSEYVYHELENGLMQRQRVRRRPGTIAIAAAIKNKYAIPVVPHIVCSGNDREDLEYMLIDLQFLGILLTHMCSLLLLQSLSLSSLLFHSLLQRQVRMRKAIPSLFSVLRLL